MEEAQSYSKITTQNLRKINHTVKSMKEQMKITENEKIYRLENFKFYDIKEDYIKCFKCTKCDKSFRNVIERGKEVCVHPLLEVLMCFSCCDYYGDGNFSMGSDDEDKYCRWCGEGGIIFSCSKCICGFCNQCIKKHFGEKTLKSIEEDDDWKCYFCDPKPLWFLRAVCSLAKEISETKKKQKKVKKENKSLKRKRSKMKFSKGYFSSSDDQIESMELVPDDNDNESASKGKKVPKKRKSDAINLDSSSQEVNDKKFEENEKQILHKLRGIWKITQLLMEIGLKASGERLNILTQLSTIDTIKDFQIEYAKLKIILNTIRSYLDKTIDTASSLKHELDFGNEVGEGNINIIEGDEFDKGLQEKLEVEFRKIKSVEVVKPILKVKSFAKMTSDNLLNPRNNYCSTKTGKNEIDKNNSETKSKQAHLDEYNKETDESSEEKSLTEKQSNTSSESEFSSDDEPYIVIKRSKKKLNKTRSSRRNIRKILNKEFLQRDTKEAIRYEEEKQKRLQEKKKLFEELFLTTNTEMETHKQLILDFDEETKEPLVVVHKNLASKLKPHQMEGIKFMWNNCFESVKRLEKDYGTGCILAHCMGFGKTLQVITLIHTVMNHDLGVNTVLIISPFGIISTWITEFDTWLKDVDSDFVIYDLLNIKNNRDRAYHIEKWQTNGGIMIVSYDLFRNLTKCYSSSKKKMFKLFENALLNPGPDLVICDEGHLIKNAESILSKCINKIKTARRIVLTGTPLQNNLLEYYCMVQFVKPNFLGSKKEFSNRFINPIVNGQFEDSTEQDVKLMKRRSHVLHSMLEGCVQRFDFSVLASYLPEKKEYAILISLTNAQINAYNYFIKTLSGKVIKSSEVTTLFNDFHYLQRIWTHPRALLIESNKDYDKKSVQTDSEGSLKDFIVHSDEEESTPSSSNEKESSVEEIGLSKKKIFNANGLEPVEDVDEEEIDKTINKYWWEEFFLKKDFEDIHASNKLLVLFTLLMQCEKVGDKVLVFSQSLNSLDIIEYFLNKVDENCSKDNTSLGSFQDSWLLGIDYFRLDGSTSSETRAAWCRSFNLLSNKRARLFLISTKAGGLGINLCGANRVVIFDASWNPSNDLQSIFRVYRFGQTKKCYIYRFLAEGTMEEKIYKRQITKLSLAERVVDEHQIERHYSMGNLQDLYNFEPIPQEKRKTPNVPQDSVLAELLSIYKDEIVAYHEQDCLLENKEEEELSEQEKEAAWRDYNEEKLRNNMCNISSPHNVQNLSVCKPNFVGNYTTETYANPFANQSVVPLNILQEVHSHNRTQIPEQQYIEKSNQKKTY